MFLGSQEGAKRYELVRQSLGRTSGSFWVTDCLGVFPTTKGVVVRVNGKKEVKPLKRKKKTVRVYNKKRKKIIKIKVRKTPPVGCSRVKGICINCRLREIEVSERLLNYMKCCLRCWEKNGITGEGLVEPMRGLENLNHEQIRKEVKKALQEYQKTLEHFNVRRKPTFFDDDIILRAMRTYGVEMVQLAIVGSRKEAGFDRFDPANFVSLRRILSEKHIERFANLGAMQPEEMKVTRIEDLP